MKKYEDRFAWRGERPYAAIRRSRESGFTLVEVLTTSFIIVTVMTIAIVTYIMLLQYVADNATQAVIQSKARLAIDKIARDARHASLVNCSGSGDSIILTFDPTKMGQEGGLTYSRYRLVDDDIMYSPDGTDDSETVFLESINMDSGDVLFSYNGGRKLLTIDVKTTNTGVNVEQDAHLTTIVKVRNAY